MNSFCDRLKELRLHKNLTQEQLAEVCNVTKKTQQNYEAGKRVPDANYLMKLAQAGYDVKYLITGERDHSELTPKQLELLQLFDSASPEYRDAVFDLMMIEQAPSPASDVLNYKKTIFKLLTGSENPAELTKEQSELLNLFSLAEPAIQSAAINMLKYHQGPDGSNHEGHQYNQKAKKIQNNDLPQSKIKKIQQ